MSAMVAPSGFAGDDRGEQPLGLDHLEVVEAERDRGVRLERTRLAVARADPVGRPRRALVVLVEAHLQLAHPPEVPGERTGAAVHLEAVGVLLADRGAAGLQEAAGTGREPQQGQDVVLVLDRQQRAARPPGRSATRRRPPAGRSVMKVDASREHGGDRARDVLGQVEPVRGEVPGDAAAGQVADEAPGQRAVGVGAVVAEHLDADVADLADPAGSDQVAGELDGGGVAVVEADGGGDAGRRDRVGDLQGLGKVASRRLLDPEVLAGLRRRPRRRPGG